MLNLEKGQKQVSQVFADWTEGLPDFGPVRSCSITLAPLIMWQQNQCLSVTVQQW